MSASMKWKENRNKIHQNIISSHRAISFLPAKSLINFIKPNELADVLLHQARKSRKETVTATATAIWFFEFMWLWSKVLTVLCHVCPYAAGVSSLRTSVCPIQLICMLFVYINTHSFGSTRALSLSLPIAMYNFFSMLTDNFIVFHFASCSSHFSILMHSAIYASILLVVLRIIGVHSNAFQSYISMFQLVLLVCPPIISISNSITICNQPNWCAFRALVLTEKCETVFKLHTDFMYPIQF